MRSSTGAHYIALDHVRALAAFSVFCWHFIHGFNGSPVPFAGAPVLFPCAVLDEGHTGVSIFMCLSGYLFAKLLDGRTISYPAFFWNRALRLFPLLGFVLAIWGFVLWRGGDPLRPYCELILHGLIQPTLPNGGWSITIELHYYLLLPFLLWLARKRPSLLLLIIAASWTVRTCLFFSQGEVQSWSYWTLAGRIDQFVFGMLLFHARARFAHRHRTALIIGICFCAIYWVFDWSGGYYGMPVYPSSSPVWIVLPTIEAIAYSSLIAWYDSSFTPSVTGVSRFVGLIGKYSYSIYLLHPFFVFKAAQFVHTRIMDLSNFYVAVLWAALGFLAMIPLGFLSFLLIEGPFLKLRRSYVVASDPAAKTQSA